jgi:two-component system, chemotaxis family, sensor kinase CheA
MSDNEIVQEFLAESHENLDRLDRELVGLEKNPKDREALASVFRTIHTIKGTCGFLGFNKLEKVAHVGENLLTLLREGTLLLNPEITTALLTMVDAIRQMLSEIQTTGKDGDEEYQSLMDTLTRLHKSGSKEKVATEDSRTVPPAPKESASGPSAKDPSTGKKKAGVSAETKAPEAAAPAQSSSNEKTKSDDASRRRPIPGRIGGVLVERGLVQAEKIALALEAQERGDQRKIGEILVSLGYAKPEDVQLAQKIVESRSKEVAAETIRVGVNLLDNLMTLVGELVLARNQLLQFSNTFENAPLQGVSQRMNLIATELQEQVMKTRMQPIGNIWSQFPRTVRDVALNCGKEVRIEMEGKETELDKTIIEAIKDPLTHLVRNSVDHGIELPEDRVNAGKDRVGRLILRAFHEGGQVNIEISDDGAGLNRERIRQKAVERGMITSDQAGKILDREIYNLIFLPGFSTAQKVTNVSGRGVGMDVVKTNVEKIGGTVDVHSKPGEGTTVRIKIPLTLAIIPALVVTCAKERFAIPQVNLTELVRADGGTSNKKIEMVHGAPVYRLRGRLLPLVYLNKELRLSSDSTAARDLDGAVNIVVLQAGERQFGLVVDEINDTQEIVVKPLRKQLKSVKSFAGASIMGDGKIALILDVMGVAQKSGVISEVRDRALAERAAELAGKTLETQTFLIFAGPDDARMALPIGTLNRLEELPVSQVEQSGTQWVAQYRGRILRLIHLGYVLDERRQERRHPKPPSASDGASPFQVLVCHKEGLTVGVIVERILDIVEDSAEMKYPASRSGVLYSAVISGRVTELIDIPAILRNAGLQSGEQIDHVEMTH